MPADHLARQVGLELVELPAVEEALEQVRHVVGQAVVVREELVELRDVAARRPGLAEAVAHPLDAGQPADILADALQALGVVGGPVVGHGADAGMGARPAEGLGVHRLAGGALHQVGPAEAHEAGPLHHEDHVGEGREVRSPRHTAAHHRAHLRHVQVPAHDRVVVEDAGGPVLAGEDAALVGEVHAGAVHEVDDRDALAHRDFLGAEDLPDRLRPPGPRLDGGVVRDDDDLAPLHHAEAGNDARPRGLPVVLVVGHQQPELEPRRARVAQPLDPLPRRELALGAHLVGARRPAARLEAAGEGAEFVGEGAEPADGGGSGAGLAGHVSP